MYTEKSRKYANILEIIGITQIGLTCRAGRRRVALKASKCGQRCCRVRGVSESDTDAPEEITWLSTKEAAKRLGVTPRTLYRFIDEGQLPGYRLGRVIRLKQHEVDAYIETCRIEPGTLEHLYPEAPAPAD